MINTQGKIQRIGMLRRVLLLCFSLNLFFEPHIYAQGVVSLDKSVRILSDQIGKIIPDNSALLVLDFQDLDGKTTYFGRYLSDQLHTALSNRKGISVIDRQSIETLLKERRLAEVGIVDEKTAAKIGKAVGANTIVLGRFTDLESTIQVNAKLVGIEKGVVLGGESLEIKKTKKVTSLLDSFLKEDREIEERQLEKQRRKEAIAEERENERRKREEERDEKIDALKQSLIQHNVKVTLLTDENFDPIDESDVGWDFFKGENLDNQALYNYRFRKRRVAVFAFNFEPGTIGTELSSVHLLARKQAALLGCDRLYLDASTVYASLEIAGATYQCLRTSIIEEKEKKRRVMEDTRIYTKEVSETNFGQKWSEKYGDILKVDEQKFLKDNGIGTVQRKNKKGKIVAEDYIWIKTKKKASTEEIQKLFDRHMINSWLKFFRENADQYRAGYEEISYVQAQYKDSDALLFPFPVLPEDSPYDEKKFSDNLAKYVRAMLDEK